MQETNRILLASEEIRSNTQKTIFLLSMMLLCIFGLSWILGELLNDITFGLKVGFLVCLIVIPLELMSARFAIISLTGCVPLNLENPAEKRILNIAEGISISAGLSRTPDVFLIESNIPNAFAAGWNENSAFIGVTTGLANMMDDQELTGVLAHEIAHIVHRDIMICQMSIALNTALLILAFIIRWVSFLCALRTRNSTLASISFFLFIFIYPVSFFIGLLLCMTLSRKREFAADALAVRLCSYNEGIARALEKLSQQKPKYTKEDVEALGGKEVESIYFYFPVKDVFSTHPDINERIHRLRAMY